MNTLRAAFRWGLRTLLLLHLPAVFLAAPAQETVLRTADEVRRLSPEEAAHHIPVHLKGVLTYADEALFSHFVQDDTAGIYFREITNMPAMHAGQLVIIDGETDAGEYAP